MSKNNQYGPDPLPSKKMDFKVFIQWFQIYVDNNPDYYWALIDRIKDIIPEEDMLNILKNLKNDQDLIERYSGQSIGITQEMIEEHLSNLHKAVAGENYTPDNI